MKELMLWRHAKASWPTTERDDFLRPLSKRGKRAAAAVARWLATRHLVPDIIYCSSASRTRETAEYLIAEMPSLPSIVFDRALYLAEGSELLAHLQKAPEATQRVLLIGHNEGIADLAQVLTQLGPPDQLGQLHDKYPTGALVWLRLTIETWKELGQGHGELIHFVRPRDIMEDPN